MSWSDTTTQIQTGDDVYGSDGDKVGSVAEVQSTYLVVEKGFFFPTDYYIPVTAITRAGDRRVDLNVTKDVALHSGWETIPDTSGATLSDAGTTAVPATDLVTGTAVDAATWQTDTAVGAPRMAGYETTSEDEIVIEVPLTQEEVDLRTQTRVAEEVVVSKEAVQHTEQVRGTVRREEVEVIEDATVIDNSN